MSLLGGGGGVDLGGGEGIAEEKNTCLVCNLEEEGGNPLRGVVEGRHVEDHLDDVQQTHQRRLHVRRVLKEF